MIGGQPDIHDKAMVAYNVRVRQFNEQAAAFNVCLKAYISNARTDLANVQKTLNAALTVQGE